ncbi:cytochrome c biogenesis protein ResB [Pelistega ratti]|uniref:cytochrome c biogenesis protein ResB n=1 Tax=Pelistega ratti TaxID=2652177 RepID=UPI001FA98CAA|nr:cytochrome c biogenesis protein ResB [Pelistega ratti]
MGKAQQNHRHWRTELFELFSSMRFAIALLVVICIASAVGTLIEQNREEIFYIDRFGTYWYQVFSKFSINQIYNTWWFLLVMGFLVISTSFCLVRNVPKIIKDMRSFKEHIRQGSFRAFSHKLSLQTDYSAEQAKPMIQVWLKKHGYVFKEKEVDNTLTIAAKKGSSNRLGYIFAHLAIVTICIGGLLDSELPNRLQLWMGDKAPIPPTARYMSDVPEQSKFGVSNISFRGNISVSEGENANHALLLLSDDRYLQNLPFDIHLNRFIIEYYETNGMPKRFASDVTITDFATGKKENKIIEVNHPYQLHGITLYQSSFHDGGSKLDLTLYPIKGKNTETQTIKTKVGETTELKTTLNDVEQTYQLTINDFRPINVENLSNAGSAQPKDFEHQILAVTGSAASKVANDSVNVGPLFQYTLTDESNQSVQYQNYMLPVQLDGRLVFLIGMKLPTDAGFSYARIPADEKGTMQEFLALKAAFENPEMRRQAAQAYADKLEEDPRIDKQNIVVLASMALEIFANNGFKGLDDYIEGKGIPEAERVPEALRAPMKSILRDYLIFSAIDLRNMARQTIGLPALSYVNQSDAEQQALWFDSAIRALSDMTFYPAPMILQLNSFEHIQATVLQATRSPGKWIVYLGCLFLIIGIFQMFYIRERRLWIWLTPLDNGSEIKGAMTSVKRTLDFQREFTQFQQDFSELARKE